MDWEPEPDSPPLSVGVLTQRLKALLERSFGDVWVRGEISNLRRQASGHLYCTLKDAEAQISAVMFRPDASRLNAPIREGDAVLAYGRLTVYPPRGNYQLVLRVMRPEGEGDLRRRFEELKTRLGAEGLFDAERKRPLPRLPKRLVVITSPTGAALRDFLSILERRHWRGTVRLLPVRVQGAEAAPEIAAAVALANRHQLGDAIVLTRGGGSLEDLWPFNEEVVARAVAASELPVVSAVGHEIDFTLSDFAADVRAETPSAAAELLSSEFVEFAEAVARCRRGLRQAVHGALERERYRVRALRETLRRQTPKYRVEQAWMRLDELTGRRERLWERHLARQRDLLARQRLRLAEWAPQERLRQARRELEHLAIRLHQASPEATLHRGYAIVRQGGQVIGRKQALAARDPIEIQWADGSAPFDPPGSRPVAKKRAPRRRGPPPEDQLDLPLGD